MTGGEAPTPAPAEAEEDNGSEGADDAVPADTNAAEQAARAAAAAAHKAREELVRAADSADADQLVAVLEAPAAGQKYTDANVESYLQGDSDLKAAYGQYLSGQLTAPDFQKKAHNPVQIAVLKQLTGPIDSAERRALLQEKLKGSALLSPAGIRANVESRKLTFREGYILMDSTTDQDVETLVSQSRMTRAEADIFQKALSTRESALSEMSKASAEGGFVGVLTKMFEKIQKLFEQIGGYLEKMFEKMNPKFKSSPIGGQKFGLKTNINGGYDLTPTAPGPVNWIGDKPGKVLGVDGDKITVGYGESRIIYTGVKDPTYGKGDTLNPGAKIGEMSGAYLTVQMVDKEGKQEDLESLLRDFTMKEEKPKEEEATPTPAPILPPASQEKAPTLQEQQYKAINEGLKPYQGKTTKLADAPFKIKIPFIEGSALSTPVECSINDQNEISLGTTLKYTMKLPLTISLEAIQIEGTAETGSAKLTAGNFILSGDKKVSIAKMIAFINTLQKDKPVEQKLVTEDGQEVTFTKVTT